MSALLTPRFDAAALTAASNVQKLALAPRRNVWISANAGTGKTEVLTRRLLSLLIGDPSCAPKEILALTFTKIGAAEMAQRLPRELARLAKMTPGARQAYLSEALGLEGTPAQAERVIALGDTMAQDPPLIRTIHSFAQEILQHFPGLAGGQGGFQVIEGSAAERLLMHAQARALREADHAVAKAVDTLIEDGGEHGWRTLTTLTKNKWPRLRDVLAHHGGWQQAGRAVRQALEVTDDAEGAPTDYLPNALEVEVLREVARTAETPAVSAILQALGQDEDRLKAAWKAFLLTDTDAPRKKLVAAATAREVEAAEVLREGQKRLKAALERTAARRVARMTEAMLCWGGAVQEAYGALKQEGRWLDYQDLLDGAESLLDRDAGGMREWIFMRLERRFKHLLIDEAQDNNAQQGRLVAMLAREFIGARGADDANRTVLAVGDVKQSIYRFQGAQPQYFLNLKDILEGLSGTEHFQELDLTHSFRSAQGLLDVVDAVFDDPELAAKVLGQDRKDWPRHRTVYGERQGCVELWPLVPYAEKPAVEPWTLPTERPQRTPMAVTATAALAARLQAELAAETLLPSSGRPLTPGDVLVLVATNETRTTVVAGLRAAGLPVSGGIYDETHPMVQDLSALLRVLHNPGDQLSLATVLKGHIGNWSDAQLMQLWRLNGALMAPNGAWARDRGLDGAVFEHLEAWRARAGYARPGVLVGDLVQAFDLPRRYAQHPSEVDDLRAACESMAEMAEALPNLAALVARLDDGVELAGGDGAGGIRVMTGHKAKGLEAPLVVLMETTRPLASLKDEKLAWPELPGNVRSENVLYRIGGAHKPPLQAWADTVEESLQTADALRGLYVALTRPRDWLWVSGWERTKPSKNDAKDPQPTWHSLVAAGLQRLAGSQTLADGRVVYRTGAAPRAAPAPRTEPLAARLDLPRLPPVAPPLREEPAAPDTPETAAAKAHGNAVHHWLVGLGQGMEADGSPAAQEALAVMQALPDLWRAHSRSEVTVRLADGSWGRLDRLVEAADGALWVIDFKTERRVPEHVPETYAAQVRAYVTAVAAQHPGRAVRGAVVWTKAPGLQWVA